MNNYLIIFKENSILTKSNQRKKIKFTYKNSFTKYKIFLAKFTSQTSFSQRIIK